MGGGKGPETPPPRDYYKETMDTLTAQVKMAPNIYAAEAAFTPKMQRLNLAGYRNTLLGRTSYDMLSDQSKSEYTSALAEKEDAVAKLAKADAADREAQANAPMFRGIKQQVASSISPEERQRLQLIATTTPDPAAFSDRGLMDILEKDIMPSMSRSENASNYAAREADIVSVERLGLRASEAYLNADPRTKGLIEELNRQAMANLTAAGSGQLTDAQQRLAVQTARAGSSARGMAMGNQGLAQEVLSTYQLAENRRESAYKNAGAVLGLNKATTADPFQAVLGRASGAFQAGIGQQQFASGMASNVGPKTFSPESQYAADLQASNSQTAAAYAAARSQVQSGIYSAVGSAAGGMMSGGLSLGGNVIKGGTNTFNG